MWEHKQRKNQLIPKLNTSLKVPTAQISVRTLLGQSCQQLRRRSLSLLAAQQPCHLQPRHEGIFSIYSPQTKRSLGQHIISLPGESGEKTVLLTKTVMTMVKLQLEEEFFI